MKKSEFKFKRISAGHYELDGCKIYQDESAYGDKQWFAVLPNGETHQVDFLVQAKTIVKEFVIEQSKLLINKF